MSPARLAFECPYEAAIRDKSSGGHPPRHRSSSLAVADLTRAAALFRQSTGKTVSTADVVESIRLLAHDTLGTEADDILIDGGNSYYVDDIRRGKELAAKRIHYVDVGKVVTYGA
jgi:hypothetical protein